MIYRVTAIEVKTNKVVEHYFSERTPYNAEREADLWALKNNVDINMLSEHRVDGWFLVHTVTG